MGRPHSNDRTNPRCFRTVPIKSVSIRLRWKTLVCIAGRKFSAAKPSSWSRCRQDDDGALDVVFKAVGNPPDAAPSSGPGKSKTVAGGVARPCRSRREAFSYDYDLIERISSAVTIPVVRRRCQRLPPFCERIRAGASAVAAANIWHFEQLTCRVGDDESRNRRSGSCPVKHNDDCVQ